MGFSPLPPHWFPPCAPFPPPHGCRRLYRSCSGIVPAAAVRATLNCCATSAVAASSWSASPTPFGPARDSRRHKSMLRHRSHPPYITFYPVPHLSPTSTFAQCVRLHPLRFDRPPPGPVLPANRHDVKVTRLEPVHLHIVPTADRHGSSQTGIPELQVTRGTLDTATRARAEHNPSSQSRRRDAPRSQREPLP